jgi:hypothetical protein
MTGPAARPPDTVLPAPDRRSRLAARFGVLSAFEAASFAVASALHFGLHLALGFTEVRGEPFLRAAIPEGIIAAALAGGTVVVIVAPHRSWMTAVTVHAFAAAGVMVGIGTILGGVGPQARPDIVYHVTILLVLLGALGFLLTAPARTALRRARP